MCVTCGRDWHDVMTSCIAHDAGLRCPGCSACLHGEHEPDPWDDGGEGIMSQLEELLDAARDSFTTTHVLELREVGWSLQHPLACRDAMLDCRVHVHVSRHAWDLYNAHGVGVGRFLLEVEEGRAKVEPLPADHVDPVERLRLLVDALSS